MSFCFWKYWNVWWLTKIGILCLFCFLGLQLFSLSPSSILPDSCPFFPTIEKIQNYHSNYHRNKTQKNTRQRIVCPSNRTSIGHGLPSDFQLQNVCARQCVGASVCRGCVPDIICVAQITFKFIDHALIVYNWGL